jgi:peroxiredoxin
MRLFLAAIVCAASMSAQVTVMRRAPSFSLPDSKFVQHDILDLRGKWVIIDFMQTNCPHCKNLAATLEEVKRTMGTKIAILEVVVPPDNLNTVSKFVSETKTTSPVLFDQGQVTASYLEITPVNNKPFDTPHWFLIDPTGVIVHDWAQVFADGKDWVHEMERLMAAKK